MFGTDIIEQFKTIRTPFYYYDMELLRRTLELFRDCSDRYGIKCHYAVKANSNDRIMQTISSYGFGADCVSGQEIRLAVKNGFAADGIVFAGVGKRDEEIRLALKNDIFCFNCESVEEIEVINRISRRMGRQARICIRINPDIDAHTLREITTGTKEDKFGISVSMLDRLFSTLDKCGNVKVVGLHFHVGSQITDLTVFENLCRKAREVEGMFFEKGFEMSHINLGGGLGVDYDNPCENQVPKIEELFEIIHRNYKPRDGQTIHIEPGRSMVAQCGLLISRVLYIKQASRKRFVILDAGMNDLIRPALYGTEHKVSNLSSNGPKRRYDVVGPVCETSDTWGRKLLMPETERGDLVAIMSAGAYGQVMAMKYNARPLAKAVYSDDIKNKLEI